MAWALPAVSLAGALVQSDQETHRTIGREWSFYPNGNGLDTGQLGVHVWPEGDKPGHKHAFGVARLDFLKGTSDYEIEFRVRFGRIGDIPSRVELWSGSAKPLQIAAGGNKPTIQVAIDGKKVFSEPADDIWRTYRVVGNEDTVQLFLYGKPIASAPAHGLPDILVFGSPDETLGTQGEAWLKIDRVTFRVPQPDDPELALKSLTAQVIELKQRQISDPSGEKWRWVGLMRVTNTGRSPLDLSVLPEIRVVTDDYREILCSGVNSIEGPSAYGPIEPGGALLQPGQSADVWFAASSPSSAPSGKPDRIEFGPLGKASKLAIPPP